MDKEEVYAAINRRKDELLDEASKAEIIDPSLSRTVLAYDLAKVIPLMHGNVVGEMDILHGCWAEALRDVYFLGCVTQEKADAGKFGDYAKIGDFIRETIYDAFKMGEKEAPEREKRTHH